MRHPRKFSLAILCLIFCAVTLQVSALERQSNAIYKGRRQALAGKTLDSVKLAAVAPGAFTLSFEADGFDLAVRLDAHGARLTSVGT